MDCSSYTELLLSEACGFSGSEIMFSSNDTPAEENAAEKPAAAHLVPEDLADMTVANLKKMAAAMGIDTKALKTKDALIQAICAEEVYPGEPMDGPDLGAEAPVV